MVTASDSPPTQPPARRRLRTVALVGIDGSGKTTQAHRLAAALAAQGLPATYLRNAGGRRWFGRLARVFGRRDAEDLLGRRGILLIESVLRWLAIARTLLRRAVSGEIAVMDRYAVCQYASLRSHTTGPGRSAAPGRAEWFARLAYRIFPAPDVTFVLAVDPAVAYERIEIRGYDHESMEYLAAAAAAYRSLPEYGSFVVIDANTTPDEVAAQIVGHLAARLPARPPSPRAQPDDVPTASPSGAATLPDAVALVESALLPGSGEPPKSAPVRPAVAAFGSGLVPWPRLVARRIPAQGSQPVSRPAHRPDPPATAEPLRPPRQSALPGEHAKAILLAAGPLTAGAATVGDRLAEAVQALV